MCIFEGSALPIDFSNSLNDQHDTDCGGLHLL